MKVRMVWMFVLAALLLSSTSAMGQNPVSATPTESSQNLGRVTSIASSEEAQRMDAQEYASVIGVELDEAIHRLQLQGVIGDLNADLAANEPTTFAGLWIQHQPEHCVIVQFTHNGEATIQPYLHNGPLANLVKVRTVSITLSELQNARMGAERIANEFGISVHSAIDIVKNHAELYVLDVAQLDTALREANVQLPAGVEVIQVSEFPQDAADIYGGVALNPCTSGFSVRERNTGRLGISTAGHCGDYISYQGVSLPVRDRRWSGAYDIQWMGPETYRVVNWVWDGSYGRAMNSVKFRSQQTVGTWICKYGKTTRYECGTIAQVDFDGLNIRVTGVTVQGGDSGGPWFYNNTAYCTTISFWGSDSIYGPPDQLGAMNVDIVTN